MARILAVDEDASVRRSIERILRRAGHEVVQASIGAAAVRLAGDHSFDVALVDQQVHNGDGISLLQRLRRIQPACLRVLITGPTNIETVMDALNRGEVTRVINKPIEAARLVYEVEEVLSARRRLVEVARVQQQVASEHERKMLRECLAGDDIKLAVQPILFATPAENRKTFAYECLLRSSHQVLNGPLPVLKAAERHGMLTEVAEVVVQRAVEWMHRLPPDVMLFMNLHPDELADPKGMLARLEPLRQWAPRVVLEITERSRLQGLDHWEEAVEQTKKLGFKIAVDDLGAGYSSLSVLAELQPRFMKVDMSIIRGIDKDKGKQRLVQMLVSFAEATDAHLIAEGVETKEEAAALVECEAHFLQGYLFSKPVLQLPG